MASPNKNQDPTISRNGTLNITNTSTSTTKLTHLNIFQLNAQKSRPPHMQLLSYANTPPPPPLAHGQVTESGDGFIALIQEPNCVSGKLPGAKGLKRHKADGNTRVRSCIYTSTNLKTTKYNQFTNNDITTIGIHLDNRTIICCSAYLPGDTDDPIDPIIKNLVEHCKKEKLDLIIGTDSNAHHIAWGCTDINNRGDELFNYIANNNINICNKGNSPTFINAIRETVLDLTLTNTLLYSKITDWQIVDTDSLSDHTIIAFNLQLCDTITNDRFRNVRRLYVPGYIADLEANFNPHHQGNLHERTEYLTNCIMFAYTNNTPLSAGGKFGTPFGNREIRNVRRGLNKLRKELKKRGTANIREEYRRKKNELQKLVKKTQRVEWKKFCKKIENTGESSRIIKMLKGNSIVDNCTMKNPDGTYTNNPLDTLNLLIDKHFPCLAEEDEEANSFEFSPDDGQITDFINLSLVREAIFSFKKYKAPGADGIHPVLLQEGFEIIGEFILQLYTDSITFKIIPHSWTQSRVVFIPKPGKFSYSTPKDFRPLSLTSFLLKGLEKLILWHIESNFLSSKLNNNLFAYRQKKSTESALHAVIHNLETAKIKKTCAILICLDIDSAFSMATPRSMVRELARTGCESLICDWVWELLTDRQIVSSWGGGLRYPQGKQGGPSGWDSLTSALQPNNEHNI